MSNGESDFFESPASFKPPEVGSSYKPMTATEDISGKFFETNDLAERLRLANEVDPVHDFMEYKARRLEEIKRDGKIPKDSYLSDDDRALWEKQEIYDLVPELKECLEEMIKVSSGEIREILQSKLKALENV